MSKQKSSLLEEAKDNRRLSGRTPLIVQVANTMTPEERKELVEALDDPTIPNAALSRVLRRRGHNISPSAIGQYRRGEIVRVIA